MKYVGIDYHERYSVVCILDDTGSIVAEDRIEHAFPERFGESDRLCAYAGLIPTTSSSGDKT